MQRSKYPHFFCQRTIVKNPQMNPFLQSSMSYIQRSKASHFYIPFSSFEMFSQLPLYCQPPINSSEASRNIFPLSPKGQGLKITFELWRTLGCLYIPAVRNVFLVHNITHFLLSIEKLKKNRKVEMSFLHLDFPGFSFNLSVKLHPPSITLCSYFLITMTCLFTVIVVSIFLLPDQARCGI